MRVVLDTNVIVSGLRSNRGASFQILQRIGSGAFDVVLSVGVVLEYEEQLQRLAGELSLTTADITDLVDYICSVGRHCEIFFLWRPCLADADDDMLLELAVAADCEAIVTFNGRDFRTAAKQFGIQILTPRQFLREIQR